MGDETYSVKRRKKSRGAYFAALSLILLEALALTACVALTVRLAFSAPDAADAEAGDAVPPVSAPVRVTEPPAPPEPTLSWAEQTIRDFAEDHGLSLDAYPESLVELLERNPETEEFVLYYPIEKDVAHAVDLGEYGDSRTVPLFLQWDRRWGYLDYGGEVAGLSACGPVCLSMVVCYLTGDYTYSPDWMIRFAIDNGYCAPGSGSYWSLISQGGADLGLDVTEFAPDKERILANLEVGNPIICIMGPGDFTASGHFIVLTGLENGLICVNDPNSRANSARLWDYDAIADQIMDLWVLRKLE